VNNWWQPSDEEENLDIALPVGHCPLEPSEHTEQEIAQPEKPRTEMAEHQPIKEILQELFSEEE